MRGITFARSADDPAHPRALQLVYPNTVEVSSSGKLYFTDSTQRFAPPK